MKLVSRVFAMTAAAAVLSFGAETWTGHLIDANCKTKDPATHTTKCAIGCASGGYGIVTADGKFVKFDKAGDEKALAALKATRKEKDLKVTVSGTLEKDTIKVSSLQLTD